MRDKEILGIIDFENDIVYDTNKNDILDVQTIQVLKDSLGRKTIATANNLYKKETINQIH